MKNITKRISVLLMVICLLAGLVLPAAAANVPSATEIITTPSGYKSAADVIYPSSGYIANWGARGEIATFVSAKAADYYSSGYTYEDLIKWSGSQDDTASDSDLYVALNDLAVTQQHTLTTYDGCRDLYGYTDCVLGDTSKLSLFYMGNLVSSTWDSGVTYNREHTWPKSKLTSQTTNDGADIMHIRPSDPSCNSSRGNTAYGESSGYYDPGVSVRGDVARMVLYMYVRWGNEGTLWGTGGVIESLDVLLKWNEADPVDTWEMGRNDAIQSITGARNMFVDYPELAYYLYNKEVPADLVTPSSFTASEDTGSDTPVVDGATATLVTDVADLAIGDQIIIATTDKNYAMGAQNGYYRDRVDITKSEDGVTVTYGDTVQVITLGNGAVGGTYSLNVGDGYLYAASSDYNNLQTETTLTANSSWKISITDGVALIEAVGENTRNTIQHNDSSPRFTCYGGATMDAVSIYALEANEACAHSYTSQTVAATCAVEGYTKYTCSSCGNFYYDSYTAKVDHNYVNGACSVCGVAEPGNNWVKVELSEITATDTIAITMTKDGTTWALFNGKGASAAPTAVVVEVSGNVMTSEDAASLSWNIVTDEVGMIIYVAGSTESWLYTTDTNNGTRVGNTTMHWVLDDASGYLKTVECANVRYLGVYTANPDWRSYKNTTGNTAGQTLSFWKLNVGTGDETCEHDYVGVVTAPTCTEGGYTTYTCSKCNDVYVDDETAAAGHSYEATVTAPTCTEGGYTTDTCTVCGHYEKRDFVDPAGHTYVNGTCSVCGDVEVTIDLSGKYYIATIRSAGGNYFYVEGAMNGTRYNAVDSGLTALPEAITAPADNMVFVFVKNADSTYCIQVDGTENYLGWTSGNTGALVAQADALNLTITIDNGAYLIHFTADDGVRYLSLNDTTYNYFAWYKDGQAKSLSLIPIDACQHDYTITTTPGTCTTPGENVYTCTLCQHSYSEVIEAPGHEYADGICVNCGEKEQAVTINEVTIDFSTTDQRLSQDASAQVWQNGIFTMTNNKASATTNVADYCNPARFYKNSNLVFDCANLIKLEIVCNTDAYATALHGSITSDGTATATVNGSVVTIEFVAPVETYTINLTGGQVRANSVTAYVQTVAGHEHEYVPTVTAPTCTEQGYTTWNCSCGDSYVDSYVSELGHTWTDATCTAPKTCSVCGATEGEALGHASYTYSYDSTNQIHSFTCTVCGETVTKTATDGKKFAINSAAPILSDDIIMKYSTTVPAGFEGAYMVFSFNGEDTTVSEYAVNASNGRYEFSFPGLNPQKMGDNICATLYAYVDGVEVSVQIASYSVVKYCDNQLKKTTITAELRTALSDLLIYGECNQIYEGYKTDVLVTSLLSANSTLTPSTFPAEGLDASYNLQKLSGTSLADCTFSSVTMTLGAKVVVRLTVTCTDTSKYTFKATLNGVDYNFTGDDLVPTGAENKYYLNFDQIKANLMGDVITFTIWEGDTQVSRTLEYSVYTYVQKNQTTTNEALANLLKALYNYGEAVKSV